ncbi:MAG TPA: oligoendopeptidase F [Clostridiales bacterium UBA8960]|nr:oligoendopeptidase F [Clostridiales bacterium UBA8960]
MQKIWSLESIYPSFESESFKRDILTLENLVTELNTQSETLEDVPSLEQFVATMEKTDQLYLRLYGYASLTFATDTGHEEALKTQNKLQKINSESAQSEAKLMSFLSKIPDFEAFIEPSNFLKNFAFILSEKKKLAEHMLSEKEEILAAKLSITGSKSWNTLQQKLTSSLKGTMVKDGEPVNLPITVIRNFAYDASPEVRKSAYDAELSAYENIAEAIAMSLNSIKGEVLTLSEMRGYTSPLEMTLEKSRMSKATLDAMLTAMEESMSGFHKYLNQKSKLMGHENGLPFYDLFAPVGKFSKNYTYEEGCKFVVDNFRNFSDKLADVALHAMENGWIDVEPRSGKRSGAFCSSQHMIGEFRVLLNYTGNLGDVTTLAHELGHGYHATCINKESVLNAQYSMPLAETASIFCETIVNQAALKIATKDEAITILENSLQDATQVICDIYSRFLFESKLFEIRDDHPLSVNELNEIMTNAQKTAYGNGLDHKTLHPYMWLIKPHYYYAIQNFYNFPYAFGLLFAKGLYAKYLDAPAFFKTKYDELLAASGKHSIVDVCKIMDIDVEHVDFWRASLAIIQKDIELFIELTE